MIQRKVEGRGHHRDAAPLRDARQQRLIRHLGKRAERRAADEMRHALDGSLRLEDVRLARLEVVGRVAQQLDRAVGVWAHGFCYDVRAGARNACEMMPSSATRRERYESIAEHEAAEGSAV